MSIKTSQQRTDSINVIRNESQAGANTKARIADVLQDISDSITASSTDYVSPMSLSADYVIPNLTSQEKAIQGFERVYKITPNGFAITLPAGTNDQNFATDADQVNIISIIALFGDVYIRGILKPAPDVTAPTLAFSIASGTPSVIDISASEAVSITSAGFSITASGGPITISSVSGSGTNAPKFNLSRSIAGGETITISYDPTTGNTTDQTEVPNELATLTDVSVTNGVNSFQNTKSLTIADVNEIPKGLATSALRLSNGSVNQAFSLAFNLKYASITEHEQCLIAIGSSSSSVLFYVSLSQYIPIIRFVAANSAVYIGSAGNGAPQDAWQRWHITYSPTDQVRLYLDGVEQFVYKPDPQVVMADFTTTPYVSLLGTGAGDLLATSASIDNLLIFNKMLSSTEVELDNGIVDPSTLPYYATNKLVDMRFENNLVDVCNNVTLTSIDAPTYSSSHK